MDSETQPVVPLNELNLFQRNAVQMSVESQRLIEITPAITYTSKSNVVFYIQSSPTEFLKPEFYLYVRCKITKDDGTNLARAEKVAPTTNFGHSMWRDVSVSINNHLISGRDSLYSYRAFLDNLLFMSSGSKFWVDGSQIYYRDTSGLQDSFDEDLNDGYKSRMTLAAGSHEMEMYFKLHTDISLQQRYILPGCNVQIVLTPNTDDFRIMSGEAARNQLVQITSLKLHVTKVTVNTRLHLGIMSELQRRNVRYPLRRVQMWQFGKGAGAVDVSETIVNNSTLPNFALLFIVSTTRMLGTYAQNPFKTVDISKLKFAYLVSDGRQYPNLQFEPRNPMTREFTELCKATGYHGSQFGSINITDFIQGYSILAFDISRHGSPNDPVSGPPKQGSITAHLQWETPTTENTSYIWYFVYNSNIFIDSSLNISTDFTNNA